MSSKCKCKEYEDQIKLMAAYIIENTTFFEDCANEDIRGLDVRFGAASRLAATKQLLVKLREKSSLCG